jgi:hypothetical protein
LFRKVSVLPLLVQQLKIINNHHGAAGSRSQTVYDVRCADVIRIVEVESVCKAPAD